MPPTVKTKEKKMQQTAVIQTGLQEQAGQISQMRTVPQGMNGAARIQRGRRAVPETRFSILEKEVMRIAHEANEKEASMNEQLKLVMSLDTLVKLNKEKLQKLEGDEQTSEFDLKRQRQVIRELQNEFVDKKSELLKTAGTFCNYKREQSEKQIELAAQAMRESNIEITDAWLDEAKASILRDSISNFEIFTQGKLKDYQDASVFDGSRIEEWKAELAGVERRIQYRKDLNAGAKVMAASAEDYKKSTFPNQFQYVTEEALNSKTLDFTDKLSDEKTRDELLYPASIRDTIENSLVMLDIWRESRRKRSQRKLTEEESRRYQRADQIMAYYEQHVNTVLGDYGMSLDRLAYSQDNINQLVKQTQNFERIDAWNRDYASYRKVFGSADENQNPDLNPNAGEAGLTESEKRLRELESQAGIVNSFKLKDEDSVYDLESSKQFETSAFKKLKKDDPAERGAYSVFGLRKDILSVTWDRKLVEQKEARLCYVCAKFLTNLKLEHWEKESFQFKDVLPLVNKMMMSYDSNGVMTYVKEQEAIRKQLLDKLNQIQRTSPIFQERRYASLLLGYLRTEQMGDLVMKPGAKKFRAYDGNYKDFGVKLKKKDRPYIDSLKSVKSEPLFSHDPMLKDIHQGALGDCYFLSALSSIVANNPQAIKEMMKDNGDGTVTVRFYDLVDAEDDLSAFAHGKTKKTYYVTVDKTIPERYYLDTHTRQDAFSKGALWVKMMEKAYAAVRDKKDYKNNLKHRDEDEALSYQEIAGGQFQEALAHLTGEEPSLVWKVGEEKTIKEFEGHFTTATPKLGEKILDSPALLYFHAQHNRKKLDTRKLDEKAMRYLAEAAFDDPKNLNEQFKTELKQYKTIEKMMINALHSKFKLMEIQSMDTDTYVETLKSMRLYFDNLISQLKDCNGKDLSDEILDKLQDYNWKGQATVRERKLESGGKIKIPAFEEIGYKLIKKCWKESGQDAEKLLDAIKGMIDTFEITLIKRNGQKQYTETELEIYRTFAMALHQHKKCGFGTEKFNVSDGVGNAGENKYKGICGTHAYTVIGVEEHEINGKVKKFLRVQNPHGGNIPLYLVKDKVNEDDPGQIVRIGCPTTETNPAMYTKATNGACLIELRDAYSAMRRISVV